MINHMKMSLTTLKVCFIQETIEYVLRRIYIHKEIKAFIKKLIF